MNAKIEFETSLKTGIDIIDNQHIVLFDLIKNLTNVLNVGVNRKVCSSLLEVVRNYFFHHFQTEEDLLSESENFKDHCLEHYNLIKQLNTFISDFRNNREQRFPSFSSFLERWLTSHIGQYDLPFLNLQSIDATVVVDEPAIDVFETFYKERRSHRRVSSEEVVDGKISAKCYNATQLKSSRVVILNMSPGGLLLGSASGNEVGDLLLIACAIGRHFSMDEKVIVKSVQGTRCGVAFVAPAKETLTFFTALYGAVYVNRARIS